MNQILSVEMPNKRTIKANGKASTKSTVIFFAIVLLLFGGALITIGIMSNSNSNVKKTVSKPLGSLPRIDISQEGTILNIIISSDNAIDKIIYNWNNETKKEVDGESKKTKEFNIDIPTGNNILNISAFDKNGLEQTFQKEYLGAEVLQATVTLQQDSSVINIVCESEEVIKSISYYFDDDDENTVTTQINDYKAEIPLDEKEGDHQLTVNVIGTSGKQLTEKAKIHLTEIIADVQNGNFIIKASNTEGISKVYIYINGETKTIEVNNTEYERTIPLQDGQNKIGIVVYNIDGVTTKRQWLQTK